MKSRIQTRAGVLLNASIILYALCAVATAQRNQIKLNENAFAFAKQLVEQGHVVPDKRSAWSEHQPSAEDENEFIREHGFGEYAKWHLGIDERHAENTKARYKFPFGDFKNVHRCGLLAVKSRAREYGYSEIDTAAARLLQVISSKTEPK